MVWYLCQIRIKVAECNSILSFVIKQSSKCNSRAVIPHSKTLQRSQLEVGTYVSRTTSSSPSPMKLIDETISPKPNMPQNIISAISPSVLRHKVLKADHREPFPVMKCLPLLVSLTSLRKCARFISVAPSGALSGVERLSKDVARLLFGREQMHLCHIGTLNFTFDSLVKNTKWGAD